MTQLDVATRLRVQRRALYEWESGVRLPTSHLPALAELYGVSATFVLHGVEPASVELQALRGEVAALRADVDELLTMLRQSTEATEAAFAVLRRHLEARATGTPPADA